MDPTACDAGGGVGWIDVVPSQPVMGVTVGAVEVDDVEVSVIHVIAHTMFFCFVPWHSCCPGLHPNHGCQDGAC